MDEIINIHFRPGLVIFVGDEGEEIYKQFSGSTLLPALDERLHQAVGLMHVPVGVERAVPLPIRQADSSHAPQFPPGMPREEGTLEVLLQKMLDQVQSERNRLDFGDRGVYKVPETRAQIYIVGNVSLTLMGTVLQAVNRYLEKEHLHTLVCYILSAYRSDLDGSTHAPKAPIDWEQRDKPSFTYLYEHRVTYPVRTYLRKEDTYYAAAEALFSHISTGLTASDIYQQIQRIEPLVLLDDPADLFHMNQTGDLTDPTAKGRSYDEYSNHVGGMSTSLIVFPRDAITEYCAALLGADAMEEWRQEVVHGQLDDSEREGERRRAELEAKAIEQWMRDKVTRSGMRNDVEDHLGPGLDILVTTPKSKLNGNVTSTYAARLEHIRYQNRVKHQTLQDRARDLFELFSDRRVYQEYRRRRKSMDFSSDGWLRAADHQAAKAADIYRNWDNAATQAWVAASQWISGDLKRKIELYLLNEDYDQKGQELAKVYIDAFDSSLAHTRDELAKWREKHEHEYSEALTRFEQMAKGPWVKNAINITGSVTQQARPTLGHQAAPNAVSPPTNLTGGKPALQGNNSSGNSSGSGGRGIVNLPPPGGGGAHRHLSPREAQIELRLRERIAWKQQQVPVWTTQTVTGAGFLATLAMVKLTLPPVPIVDAKMPLTSSVLAGLAVSGYNVYLYRRRVREVNEAKKELLQFYSVCYAHMCERREDELRVVALGPLRRRVQKMRERLDNMMSFTSEQRDALCDQAQAEHDALFDGPSGIRDIFIANGERLQRQKTQITGAMLQELSENANRANTQKGRDEHTLASFKRDLDQLRVRRANGETEWHRTIEAIRRRLVASFREEEECIIELRDDVVQQRVHTFMKPIIKEHLRGSLVEIQYALDKEEVWEAAFDRVQKPIYYVPQGQRNASQIFICGRNEDMARGKRFLPREDIVKAYTDNRDWFLVASLFQGGLLSSLGHEVLFPLKGGNGIGRVGVGAVASSAHVVENNVVGDANQPNMPPDPGNAQAGIADNQVGGAAHANIGNAQAGIADNQVGGAAHANIGNAANANHLPLEQRVDRLLDGEDGEDDEWPEEIDLGADFDDAPLASVKAPQQPQRIEDANAIAKDLLNMLGRDLQNDRPPDEKVVSSANNREDGLVGDSEQTVEEQGRGHVAGPNQNGMLKNADGVVDRYRVAVEVDREKKEQEKKDQEKKNKQRKDQESEK